jgi:hypothetical protein
MFMHLITKIKIRLWSRIISSLHMMYNINYMSNRRPYLVKFNFLSKTFKCIFSILVHFPNIVFNGLINITVELCLKRLQNSQGIVIGFSSAGGGSSLNFSNCPREKRISYGIINGGYMYSFKMKMINKKVISVES